MSAQSGGRPLLRIRRRHHQWIFDLGDEADPRPPLNTPYAEWGGRPSPDGRWIAFTSNGSGTSQVYVAPGARRAVSATGGFAPQWHQSGGELFYLGPARTLIQGGRAATASRHGPP